MSTLPCSPEDFDRSTGGLEEQVRCKLGLGSHACLHYDSREEQLAAIVPFMQEGLKGGERCIYIVDDRSTVEVLDALGGGGIDVYERMREGALMLLSKRETYLRSGDFSTEGMLALLQECTDAAIRAGFKGMRLAAEMTWALGPEPGNGQLREYEAILNKFIPARPMLAVCQYSTRRFPPEMIRDQLRIHPSAIMGQEVYAANLFSEPPEMLKGTATAADQYQWMRSRLEQARDSQRVLASLAQRHREAEERFRLLEERLRLAVECTGIGTWDFDVQEAQFVSDLQCKAILGLQPRANVDGFLRVAHPEDRARVELALHDAFDPEYGGIYSVEYRVKGSDERDVRWVEARGRVLFDQNKVPFRFIGVVLDITKRKTGEAERARLLKREQEARAAAQASERRYRFLAESMPQIVWTAKANGYISYVNRVFTQYTGMSPERVNEHWTQIVHTEDLPRTLELWGRSLETGELFELEHRLRRHDGVYRWFLGRAMAMRADDGRVVRWFGTQTDIDDLKKTESELKEAVRARDEFLSIASHELRTPLTPLQLQLNSLVQAMTKAGVMDDRLHGKLEQAERQVLRLKGLVDNLLDVSRIVEGRVVLQLEEFELTELVAEVIETVTGNARPRSPRVEFHRSSPVRGRWDRLRIEQVVDNLLSNAIKYGLGKPIEVSIEPGDGIALLRVRDFGMGIAPEDVKRIFDRFERAVSARHFGGLGLGLYITRQIVEAHGGSIVVQSVPKVGSTFTVLLPQHSGAVSHRETRQLFHPEV